MALFCFMPPLGCKDAFLQACHSSEQAELYAQFKLNPTKCVTCCGALVGAELRGARRIDSSEAHYCDEHILQHHSTKQFSTRGSTA